MRFELFVLAALSACSSGSAKEPRKKPVAAPPRDAGPPGIKTIPGFDPASGMHLDDDTGHHVVAPQPVPASHTNREIDVTLRSTPSGAEVAVDGTLVGVTPSFWMGEADGHEHEFTFVLAGHAVARYRFVPVTSGVIHARLEAVTDESDAGVGDDDNVEGGEMPVAGSVLVNPPPAPMAKPDAIAPLPAPPRTVIAPDASTGGAPSTGFGPQP